MSPKTDNGLDLGPLDLDLLRRLSEARGVSGDEGRVRRILVDAVGGRLERLHADGMGNLYGSRAAKPAAAAGRPAPRVMLAAHMDEVGLMVTQVGRDGLLAVDAIGGLDARVLAGQPVLVGPEGLPGVIGLKPVHLSAPGEREQPPKIKDLRVDIGVDSGEAADRLVNVGDGVTFATDFQDLGPTLLGKAFDDRGGCAVLCALLDQDYPVTLEAVFTVQEEVGLRGAQVAAHRLAPDCAIVLECGTTDDTPKARDDTPVMRLGAGPAITVMDRSLIADRRLVAHLVATADDLGIPYQIRAPKGGGTDGGRIHLSRAGVPTAVVSMPCRYLHAPASLLAKSDMRHTIALLRAALQRLSWKDLER
ncbi:MAG: M42 family metallopeptidase [Anaerolineae bacterium]